MTFYKIKFFRKTFSNIVDVHCSTTRKDILLFVEAIILPTEHAAPLSIIRI